MYAVLFTESHNFLLKGLSICNYKVTGQTNIFNIILRVDSEMVIKNIQRLETPTSVCNGNNKNIKQHNSYILVKI